MCRFASSYGAGMDGTAAGLPADSAEAAADSVGGAHEVAAQVGGDAAVRPISAPDHAFVDAHLRLAADDPQGAIDAVAPVLAGKASPTTSTAVPNPQTKESQLIEHTSWA